MKSKKTWVLPIIVLLAFMIAIPMCALGAVASAEVYSLEVDNTIELPSSFVSPYISPIKDQGVHGTCWAFSTLATLESNLKAMGFINEESTDGYFDLSEQAIQMGLVVRCQDCGGEVYMDNYDFVYRCKDCGKLSYGTARIVNDPNMEGAFEQFAIGYMIANNAIYKESDYPYNADLTENTPVDTSELTPLFTITEVQYIDPSNKEEMKNAIYNYGAVTMNCSVNKEKMHYVYNEQTNDYSLTFGSTKMPVEIGGHAMTIVGYDDNFSKDNFKVDRSMFDDFISDASDNPAKTEFYLNQYGIDSLDSFSAMTDEEFRSIFYPQNDGAWLIKNSWGDGVITFDSELGPQKYSGYIWMSYEDISLYNLHPESPAYAFTGIKTYDTTSGIKEYSLDETAAVSHIKPKTELLDQNKEYSVANVYNFEQDFSHKLEYFTYTTINGKGSSYDLFYAEVFADGTIEKDYNKMALLYSGTISKNGFCMVNLQDTKILPQSKGALVMRLSANQNNEEVNFGADTLFYDIMPYDNSVTRFYYPLINDNESFVIIKDKLYSPYDATGKAANFAIRVGVSQLSQSPNVLFGAADYSAMDDLLVSIEERGYSKNDYTATSWAAYEKAYNSLTAYYQDNSLSYNDQQTIEQAVQDMQDAIASLEEKKEMVFSYTQLASIGIAAFIGILLILICIHLLSVRRSRINYLDKGE